MKCRVCGNELNPAHKFCDYCGTETPVIARTPEPVIAWNTYGYPKIHEVPKDIQMVWPDMNRAFTKQDNNYDSGSVPQMNWNYDEVKQDSSPVQEMVKTDVQPEKTKRRYEWNPRTRTAEPVIDDPKPEERKPQNAEDYNTRAQYSGAGNNAYAAGDYSGVSARNIYPEQTPSGYGTVPSGEYLSSGSRWTMPAYTWKAPSQQQVDIPREYNVKPRPMPDSVYVAPVKADFQPAKPVKPVFDNSPAKLGYGNKPKAADSVSSAPQNPMASKKTDSQMSKPSASRMTEYPDAPAARSAKTSASAASESAAPKPVSRWTMPSSAWIIPGQQTVDIPKSYNAEEQLRTRQKPAILGFNTDEKPAVSGNSGIPDMPQRVQPLPPDSIKTAPRVSASAAEAPVRDSNTGMLFSEGENNRDMCPFPELIDTEAWLDQELSSPHETNQFFTFNKKNEEFQKLLDQEYEKYRKKHDAEPEKGETSAQRSVPAAAVSFNEDRPQSPFGKAMPVSEEQAANAASESPEGSGKIKIPSAGSSMQGTISSSELRKEIEKKEAEIAENEAKNSEKLENERQRKLREMEEARNAYFGIYESLKATGNYSAEELRSGIAAAGDVPVPGDNAVNNHENTDKRSDDAEVPGSRIAENPAANSLTMENAVPASAPAEASGKEESTPEPEPKFEQKNTEPVISAEAAALKSSPDKKETAAAVNTPVAPETEKDNAFRKGHTVNLPPIESREDFENIFAEYDKYDRRNARADEKRGGGLFGNLILMLLVVLIVLTGIDLVAINLLDDGPVVDFFNYINMTVIEKVDSLFTKDDENEDIPTVPVSDTDSNDDRVKELSFSLQEIADANNRNIKIIGADLSLVYNPDTEYSSAGIEESTASSQEDIKECYTVLIAYNSSWIDYVNSGQDLSCLDYIMPDSVAYKIASEFDDVGKVTEDFNYLTLGEVRENNGIYYVFAKESISVSSNGTTADNVHDVVYRMQKNAKGEFKITDYAYYQQ